MPIIKYTLVSMYYETNNDAKYYDIEEVHAFIEKKFGIKIPTMVLQRVIVFLEKKGADINIKTFEKGNKFQIKGAWDASVNIKIDEMTMEFDKNMELLEQQYIIYKNKENVEDDKKFIDFISDNAEDILGYFENNDAHNVDGRYSIMAYYLDFLHKSNSGLFNTANQLFWGSIVAGFLKRNNPEIDGARDADKVEYYIDTALVMALLDLATPEHKNYADDVLDIINASGGIARVHPITVKEIKNILLKVENIGYPLVNTEIASAFERRNLSAASLAEIRVKLSQLIDKKGMSIMPMLNENEIKKIVHNYKDKTRVKELSKQRNKEGFPGDDNFREVHDIYMDDFIKSRCKGSTSHTCIFVTWNADLIRFCRNKSYETPSMIHPGKIIVEMWMHSAKTSTLQNQVLTEALARCMVINNRDVRRKLGIVSKYYNASSKNYDPEVYKAIILGLYKKAKDVVSYVDEVEDNILRKRENADNAKLIVRACEAAMRYQKENVSKFSNIQEQIDKLASEATSQTAKIEKLTTDNAEIDRQLKKASDNVSELKNKLQVANDNWKNEQLGRENAEKRNKLYEERDELLEDKKKKRAELKSLKEGRNKSFKNREQCLWLGITVFLVVLIISAAIYSIFSGKYGLLTICVVVGYFTVNSLNRYNALRDNKEQRRADAYKVWEGKNERYKLLYEEYQKTVNRIESINEDIKRLKND